jgi:hypothetical protein
MTGATPHHHPLSAYVGKARVWRAECATEATGAYA